jgi:hypothetical protein
MISLERHGQGMGQRNLGKQGATLCSSTGFFTGPSPDLGGLQIPAVLVVGLATSHPGVLGSISNERNQGKQGATCVGIIQLDIVK